MVAGRPRIEIDMEKLRKLANNQCTDLEIAAQLGISLDTLSRNFAEKAAYYRAEGLAILRCAQWEKAITKMDSTMLKHLGKCYLGQKDELTLTTNEPSVRQLLNKWESAAGSRLKIENASAVSPDMPSNAVDNKILPFPINNK